MSEHMRTQGEWGGKHDSREFHDSIELPVDHSGWDQLRHDSMGASEASMRTLGHVEDLVRVGKQPATRHLGYVPENRQGAASPSSVETLSQSRAAHPERTPYDSGCAIGR